MPSDLMNKVAMEVAQQNAMGRGGKFLPHGSRLFMVEQGWESKVIAGDPGVALADTQLALEAALRNPENKVIFIPIDAALTEGDIEKLCQRNAATRTLFKEVKRS